MGKKQFHNWCKTNGDKVLCTVLTISVIFLASVLNVEPEPEPIILPPVVATFEPAPQTKDIVAPQISVSDEEIDLLALVTMAEAEGECDDGKRLVIDTILNRVDHSRFPNTITNVIYQPNQFEAMWNGRVDRCCVREDIRQLVIEELLDRTNTEVVFFRAGRYSSYGAPLFKVGNHYFSRY